MRAFLAIIALAPLALFLAFVCAAIIITIFIWSIAGFSSNGIVHLQHAISPDHRRVADVLYMTPFLSVNEGIVDVYVTCNRRGSVNSDSPFYETSMVEEPTGPVDFLRWRDNTTLYVPPYENKIGTTIKVKLRC